MKQAEIAFQNGRPTLLADGKSLPPVLYGLSDFPAARSNTAQAQRNIAHFAAAGVDLVTADTNLAYAWHKASPFDAEPLQAEIAGVLEANPRALVLLRLHMNPPYWWLRDHPEEAAYYNGRPGVDDGEPVRMIRDDGLGMQTGLGRLRVSLASTLWLEEAGERLRLLCEQLSQTEEGNHLLGIQVACGVFGEWHQWGVDDGPAMEKRFRRYLKETYGSDAALQKAWGDDTVTLETARFIPDFARPGDDGAFRDPVKARDTMDAQLCIQHTPPEAILHFCRIIKENWPRPILAGSFYGYYLGTGGDQAVITGHLLPELIFQHPGVVDCLCAPFPYMQNRLADGMPMSRGLLESMRLNHTLWLTEMDQHPVGTSEYVGGDPAHFPETIAQLRRNVLLPLLGGMGLWYYDHRIVPGVARLEKGASMVGSIFFKKGWWDHPVLMEEIQKLQSLAREREGRPYRPTADVLVVYDPRAPFSLCRDVDEQYALHDALGHSGATYDAIYLQDLEKAEMDRYRLVIFANAYCLSPACREKIQAITAAKHVMYFYAPGYSDGQTLDTEHIREVTGMAVGKVAPETACESRGGALPAGRVTLEKAALSPAFAIRDPQALPLAYYAEGGDCCAARKGNIWYFALPRLSVAWMRTVLRAAGAHIYCTAGDAILADGDYILINSATGGTREITLRNGTRFSCTLSPLTTAVFDAETGLRRL